MKPRRLYDPRPAHALTAGKKTVIATNAIKNAIESGPEATVTVVPIVEPLPYIDVKPEHLKAPIEIGYVRVISYR